MFEVLKVVICVKGMGIIEQLDPPSFSNYIKKYRNTICGRHPIGVLLNVSAPAPRWLKNQKRAPVWLLKVPTIVCVQRWTTHNSLLNPRGQRSWMSGSFRTRVNVSTLG